MATIRPQDRARLKHVEMIEFVDTTDRQRTLVASRFAGTCSSLPLAVALFRYEPVGT